MHSIPFEITRLDPERDVETLLLAFRWDTEDVPEWFRRAETAWGADTQERFLERARRKSQADFAINKNGQTAGIISVEVIAPGVVEFFFSAPRHSDAELMTQACWQIGSQLLRDRVADKLVSWVARLNRGAMRLNKACGMSETGISVLKGHAHGRVIEWAQLQLTRERWCEITGYVEEIEAADTTADHEYLRHHQPAGERIHQSGGGLASAG